MYVVFESRWYSAVRYCTHVYVVLYLDEVAPAEVGGGQGWDVEHLPLPVVRGTGVDAPLLQGGQLPGLGLHDLALGRVLDRLRNRHFINK